jgi:hypothetical protein
MVGSRGGGQTRLARLYRQSGLRDAALQYHMDINYSNPSDTQNQKAVFLLASLLQWDDVKLLFLLF